ncbi:VanW family protein [Cellulomonas fengjieae]|uniref:VanW family protein n=1 Tax=Cellulomonas fengjieae TaxID=2819978 RepID=A0ABS3SL49_9CELL|nr:VanW family protein [Cellulomonas fengjieae]MBO3086455.1 VanW family protein [Cellulomonas fengjieae]QVI66681.1 VanW family protein [Cellulomonas fengjieae]
MSKGTERDEPGQRIEDGPRGATESSDRTSDPVWPVWGGNGATTPIPAVPPADELAPVSPPAGEPTDEPAADGAHGEDVPETTGPVGEVADETLVDEGAADVAPVDEAAADVAPVDEAADVARVDEVAADVASADEPAADGPPVDEDAADVPPADEAAVDVAPVDEVAADVASADEPAVDEPAADEPPVDEDAADVAPVDAEEAPDDQVAADDAPVHGPADEAPVDESAVAEPAVAQPALAEPAVDDGAADETPVDEEAADEVPADEGAAEVASSDGTDGTDATEAPTADVLAHEVALEEAGADQVTTEEPVADETVADETVADEPVADLTDADATGTDEPVADEAGADDAVVGDAVADETQVPAEADAAAVTPDERDADGAAEPTRTGAAGDPQAPADADPTADASAAEAGTAEAGTADATDSTEPARPTAATSRDDATAVMAPVAAAAATTSAPPAQQPAPGTTPIGTLAAPVTRTVPGSGTSAPSNPAPVFPATTAAAASSAGTRADTAPGEAPAARTGGPIPSGPVPPSERKESPLDGFEPDDGRRRWPRRLLVVAAVVVVLCAAYVGASYALADRVARGVTVAGVDVGGLSSEEAVDRLDEELEGATTLPIDVVANDVQATIDPAAAGLTFDAEATVDELTGVNLAQPQRLWGHLVGVGEHDPVTAVDDDALAAAIDDLGSSLTLPPVDGTVVFVDGSAQSTAAVDGWDLDPEGAADVLAADWLVAARPIELPAQTVEPDITQAETEAAVVQAQQVTSAPVAVAVAGRSAALDVPTLAANASFVPSEGALVLQMNGEGLAAAVLAQLPDLLTESADAHFEFVNNAPVIIPGTPGTSLDPAALSTAVATASTATDRTAAVELVQADPAQSTAELEALGIKEVVGEFSTPLNNEPRRTVNIANGASKISGTLIRPEEIFSLTQALGPIDAAHGYVEAGAIVSGEHKDAWGGGLSQISTTTYNAAFLAGFEDVEHRPHSEWFSRYPEGREATIFTGTLDMRWKNNTPYGALVQAWVSDGRVYVRVWGTKHWTVESITSPRSGVVQPTTVYSQSPTCEPQSAGNPGFSVTVTRKISLNGELAKTESNSWRYKPQNKIICGAPPAPTAPATP